MGLCYLLHLPVTQISMSHKYKHTYRSLVFLVCANRNVTCLIKSNARDINLYADIRIFCQYICHGSLRSPWMQQCMMLAAGSDGHSPEALACINLQRSCSTVPLLLWLGICISFSFFLLVSELSNRLMSNPNAAVRVLTWLTACCLSLAICAVCLSLPSAQQSSDCTGCRHEDSILAAICSPPASATASQPEALWCVMLTSTDRPACVQIHSLSCCLRREACLLSVVTAVLAELAVCEMSLVRYAGKDSPALPGACGWLSSVPGGHPDS